MQRVQELLGGRVAARLDPRPTIERDPRPAAIVGAAFGCMQAARNAWLESDQTQPFGQRLDEAMATFTVA